jgi:hypothetical protein
VLLVPVISTFYGLVITMYFTDHPPPHFHVRHGEYEAQVEIATGRVVSGFLTRRAANMAEEWAGLHQDELAANWVRAEAQEQLVRIDPLP